MTDFARRTINELLVRYELEPELKDIFVEGQFDQDVLTSYFRSAKQIDRMVYEIDSVEVPSELLIKHGLTEGNKQRVIALSRELAGLPVECLYRCFIDKDLDHWFDPLESTARLVWTEFCSIELNFFSDEILHDVLISAAKTKIALWEQYIESMTLALCGLYALRLADRQLGWDLKWLSIDRCLSYENSRVNFNFDDYVDRLLKNNRKSRDKKQFETSVDEWKGKLVDDHRNFIRGHDLVELLAWTVNKFRGIKEFSSPVAIQRLFVLLAPKASGLEKGFL
jgi:hypothetical protein